MDTNSPLFPVFCLVLALVAATQLVIHFVKAIASISTFLVSACAKLDEGFFTDLRYGYYAI